MSDAFVLPAQLVEGEPRVRDTDLGALLGMTQPLNIRQRIETHRAELEGYGNLPSVKTKPSAPLGRGRPGTEYWLNEEQARFICALSRMEKAKKILDGLSIEVVTEPEAVTPSTELVVSVIENEPRVRDLDLAVRLGFDRPTSIRVTIKRHADELATYGQLHQIDAVVERDKRGAIEVSEFWLNEEQALLICMLSRTEKAKEVRAEVIRVFMDYRRGELQPVVDPMALLNDPLTLRGLLSTYSEKVLALEAKVEEAKPIVGAYRRIAETDGLFSMTEAAKVLGQPPRSFIRRLHAEGWIYRRAGNNNWTAYQGKIVQGLLDHKISIVILPNGMERAVHQVMVTSKGLTNLAACSA